MMNIALGIFIGFWMLGVSILIVTIVIYLMYIKNWKRKLKNSNDIDIKEWFENDRYTDD